MMKQASSEVVMGTTFDEALANGISRMESGEYAKAADAFRGCLALEPANAEGYFYLGEALSESGQADEAITALKKGLDFAPEDLDGLTALGDVYFEAGRHKDALA